MEKKNCLVYLHSPFTVPFNVSVQTAERMPLLSVFFSIPQQHKYNFHTTAPLYKILILHLEVSVQSVFSKHILQLFNANTLMHM